MKRPHIIAETDMKAIDLKYWEGKPLNAYFEKLQSFLTQQLGEDFGDLLAKPQLIKGRNKMRWLASSSASKVYPLTEAPDEKLRMKGQEVIQVTKDLADRLQTSQKKNEQGWGKLLMFILQGVTVTKLYTDGTHFFIPSWGVDILDDSRSRDFSTGFTVVNPIGDREATTAKNVLSPEQADEAEKSKGVDEITSAQGEQPKEIVSASEEAKQDLESDEQVDKEQFGEANFSTESNTEEAFTTDTSEEETEEEPPFATDRIAKPPANWWGHWWKWLLIFLALLVLIFLLFRGCESQQDILPPAPVLPPVADSTEIGYDEDSLTYIVKNRINVVISSEQSIEEFAQEFAKLYPQSNKYKIVYYGDDKIKRIQLEVPSEERSDLIKNIPNQFPAYKLLVYQEGLFRSQNYPSDPAFSENDKAWYFELINAPIAWNKSWGSENIVVAVLDDGFDIKHSELAGKIVSPYNVYTGNTNLLTGMGGKHGTHVAGTAVGNRDNGLGLSGIAPDCKLMPIRVADSRGVMTQTAIVDGILYAINQGVDVINMSLGMSVSPFVASLPINLQRDIVANSMKQEEAFWQQLFQIAEDNEVTVVLAGGNQNVLIGLDPMRRGDYTINVSAIDPGHQKADFSNFGEHSTLSAPGVFIYSSTPNEQFEFLQGTSMAAPIVTGGVALIKSVYPNLSNEEIRNLLVQTALPLTGDIGPLIQLDQALAAVDSSGSFTPPEKEECADIHDQIDSLLLELERLRGLCPDAFERDTMQIPEVIEDLNFTLGVWESTTYLSNDSKEKVVIRFEFLPGGVGTISFMETNGLVFEAGLYLSHTQNTFIIDQQDKGVNQNSNKEYYRYLFNCNADAKGKAVCYAQNKTVKPNYFNFRLIKIR